jgi:hypothetical protein
MPVCEYPLAQASGHVWPLGTRPEQLGYDPPTGIGDGGPTHWSGSQVNVGCVHTEAPGAVPVQVPVTEVPLPPSERW